MNLNRIINDYVECNDFEIKILKNKVHIYYYDEIKHFSLNKIVINNNKSSYTINGKNLVIETLSRDFLLISGLINSIEMDINYE